MLVSSGAIAAGLAPLGLTRRPRDLATQQAAAQRRAGAADAAATPTFARHGLTVGQVLLTVDDVTRRAHYRNAYRTLRSCSTSRAADRQRERHRRHRARSGSATTTGWPRWSPRWSTPTCWCCCPMSTRSTPATRASRRAARIAEVRGADDLAGVRDRPRRRAGVGTGGMATKVEAARIATGAGIPVVLTSRRAGRRRAGRRGGRHLVPRRPATPAARLLWLAHATGRAAGCTSTTARCGGRRAPAPSLLPAGITGGRRQVRRRRPGRPGRPRRPRRSPGAWSTTTPRSCPALLGRSSRDLKPRARPGVRARGRPPRRPGTALRSAGRWSGYPRLPGAPTIERSAMAGGSHGGADPVPVVRHG